MKLTMKYTLLLFTIGIGFYHPVFTTEFDDRDAVFDQFPGIVPEQLNDLDFESAFVDAESNLDQTNDLIDEILKVSSWANSQLLSEPVWRVNLTSSCARDFTRYIQAILDTDIWALRMADSTGKRESGIIDGNTLFEGRYFQCLRSDDDVVTSEKLFEPQYCVTLWPTVFPELYRTYIRGLGLCLPDTCTDDDAAILLKTVYAPALGIRWLPVRDVAVSCDDRSRQILDTEAIVTIVILSLLGAFVLIATVYDWTIKARQKSIEQDLKSVLNSANARSKPKQNLFESLLLSFSLYRNLPPIVSTKQPPAAITCLNGLRFIAMCAVILGHTYGFILYAIENWYPFYSTDLKKMENAKLISLDLYVDTFFILSAFLMSMSFLSQLQRSDGKLTAGALGMHYFNRYWRLTPTYFIVLMIYTNLWRYFAKGPFEPAYLGDADVCATEWWKNLLYINNLFITDGQMCMSWSWYLCVDMQLFIIAPLFLYLLYRWEKMGVIAVVLAFTGGVIANGVLFERYYSQPVQSDDPMDSDEEIYFVPWTRCPVYFMGLLLGYIYFKLEGEIKLSKWLALVGWSVAICINLLIVYLPPLFDGCYQFTVLINCHQWTLAGQATWSALLRPMWGLWVCWVIVACSSGYGGFVNSFLSWNLFAPLGRLTYIGYLIHIPLLMSFSMNSSVQLYATDYFMVQMFFATLLVTCLLSLVLSATVSAPLTRVMTVLLGGRDRKDSK